MVVGDYIIRHIKHDTVHQPVVIVFEYYLFKVNRELSLRTHLIQEVTERNQIRRYDPRTKRSSELYLEPEFPKEEYLD